MNSNSKDQSKKSREDYLSDESIILGMISFSLSEMLHTILRYLILTDKHIKAHKIDVFLIRAPYLLIPNMKDKILNNLYKS